MKGVSADLAVDVVSILLLMQLSSCIRYMLRPLIRSATTASDDQMVTSPT